MPRTIKEIYPTIEKYVSKDSFTWIVKDCLGRPELEMIINQCRIEIPGGQNTAASSDVLSREISMEFFKNPKARELIAFYLDASSKNERETVSQKSMADLLTQLRDPQSPMIATGKVGKYLWALLVDERPEIINIIPIFILKVLETIRKFTNILQQMKSPNMPPARRGSIPVPKPPPLDPFSQKAREELNAAKREAAEFKEAGEKLKGKNEQLEERISDLQNQFKTALTEVQQMKHERNIHTKKIKELESLLEELRSRQQGPEDLGHRMHQFERENKMLRYELEKKTHEIESLQNSKHTLDKEYKSMVLLENKLRETEEKLSQKEEELLQIKDAMKKEALARKAVKKVFKSSVPRVGIFVDVQNIYYAAREKYESKLDFQKLLHESLQGRRLVNAFAYVVKTREINQENFINTLESIGYEVKARNLKIRSDGSAKGDWDLGIAIDTISLIDRLDVVVLVSGDGDFVDLVKMLQSKNIRVEVASFLHNTSPDLIDAVDMHYILDEKVLLT